jgi:hypothetical protein
MTPNDSPTRKPLPASRRDFLSDMGTGLSGIALDWLLASEQGQAAEKSQAKPHPARKPAKAKRIVQVFLTGGVSQVDTFDDKPELEKRHGQEMPVKEEFETFNGKVGKLQKSPWKFRPRGESGLPCSDLLPHLATCVDDVAFLKGMIAKSANHGPGQLQMNTGWPRNGFPSLGAWLSYGLGRMTDNLPTFVVLPEPRGIPAGGVPNWGPGFLPSRHQGVAFHTKGAPVTDLFPPKEFGPQSQVDTLEFLETMNHEHARRFPGNSDLAARMEAYELAAKLQTSIPEVSDFSKETPATAKLYGLDDPICGPFARNCLMARRLIERDVRFVQLYQGGSAMKPRVNWDAHEDIVKNHGREAAIMDRPVAGLIKDLKQRGLLEDTLFVWTTEFGRTPFSQGNTPGRDHNQLGFTVFMAGAGVKSGVSYGETDEFGHRSVDQITPVADFHATILHLLGLDHERLTYRYSGRDFRITDVSGRVIKEILS